MDVLSRLVKIATIGVTPDTYACSFSGPVQCVTERVTLLRPQDQLRAALRWLCVSPRKMRGEIKPSGELLLTAEGPKDLGFSPS